MSGRVLAERLSSDGRVTWQARISGDRGRLQVVGIVAANSEPTEIQPLSEAELLELLSTATPDAGEDWVCLHCRATNPASRRWCRVCSNHLVDGV